VLAAGLASSSTAKAEEDPALDAPYPRPAHFCMRASAGAAYRSLYGIDVKAGTLDLTMMADTARGSFGAGLFGFVGTTEEDLVLSQWGIHGEFTWFLGDRLRLGFMPRLASLKLERFTGFESASGLALGVGGRVGVDLYREEGVAFALGVEPTLDKIGGADGWLPSVGAYLEVRYREPRAPPARSPSPPPPRGGNTAP